MTQQTPATTSQSNQIDAEAVLCLVTTPADLRLFAADYEPLHHIGFTGVVVPDELASEGSADISGLEERGFTVHRFADLDAGIELSKRGTNASELWEALSGSPEVSRGVNLGLGTGSTRSEYEAITLLQMTSQPVPLVPINPELVYSTQFREQRELLRSLVFWRKRFEIARHKPNLVHAGEDGLLIFTVDSWLISLNQNTEEAGIDLGSHGSMWLMLGTQNDVHLHGSMLILPARSGAIVANELAR